MLLCSVSNHLEEDPLTDHSNACFFLNIVKNQISEKSKCLKNKHNRVF